jgi:hypothetical protein
MDSEDRRFICNALGFTLMLMRTGALPAGEQLARARGLAGLIEAFCREAPKPKLLDRMAATIAAVSRMQGNCLPQDLAERGFTPDEIAQCWQAAKALAAVEMKL